MSHILKPLDRGVRELFNLLGGHVPERIIFLFGAPLQSCSRLVLNIRVFFFVPAAALIALPAADYACVTVIRIVVKGSQKPLGWRSGGATRCRGGWEL